MAYSLIQGEGVSSTDPCRRADKGSATRRRRAEPTKPRGCTATRAGKHTNLIETRAALDQSDGAGTVTRGGAAAQSFGARTQLSVQPLGPFLDSRDVRARPV